LITLSRFLKSAPLLAVALAASTAAPAFAAAGESTVVYVSTGDVVVKSADGKLLNYTTPAGTMVTVAGKKVPASGLKPGAKLDAPPAGDPKSVTGVSVETGKVYQIDPPDKVTLTLAQGIKELSIPAGTTFTVGGKPVPAGQLQKGMEVSATIVTVSSAAPTAAPATPPQSGTILLAAADGEEEKLPEAGTNLPLFGVLGFSALLLGFALRSSRFSANKA
jgi:hypothetical protein